MGPLHRHSSSRVTAMDDDVAHFDGVAISRHRQHQQPMEDDIALRLAARLTDEKHSELSQIMISLEEVILARPLLSARRSIGPDSPKVSTSVSSRKSFSLPTTPQGDRRGILRSLRALINMSPPRGSTLQQQLALEKKEAQMKDLEDLETNRDGTSWQLNLKSVLVGAQFAAGMSGSLFSGLYEGREVAVKILKQPKGEEERRLLAKQFRQEVAVLSRLQHQNIVEFIGAYQKESVSCIVTEFLPGGTIRNFLNKQHFALPTHTVVRMAIDIAQGMQYLHSQGVIHRDLKSDNLIISKEGVVKVMDFGVARFTEDMDDMTAETGTYRWMAPEVMDSKPYSFKVDVYSFGIVLWELWTRELPFDGMTPLQAAYAVFNKSARPAVPALCPQPLARLMQACWQADPQLRPDFSTVVKTLQSMLDGPARGSSRAPSFVSKVTRGGEVLQKRESGQTSPGVA